MMKLRAESVFVGSGIFKSGDPERRDAAIVGAVAYYDDPKKLAGLSEDLGEPMVGVGVSEPRDEERRAKRGRRWTG
jgi:pyridoxal 5'-phosphate synthase pdxS subunit